jgi:hypothetical protein
MIIIIITVRDENVVGGKADLSPPSGAEITNVSGFTFTHSTGCLNSLIIKEDIIAITIINKQTIELLLSL